MLVTKEDAELKFRDLKAGDGFYLIRTAAGSCPVDADRPVYAMKIEPLSVANAVMFGREDGTYVGCIRYPCMGHYDDDSVVARVDVEVVIHERDRK
jgi:hypothetical protein